MNKLFTKKETVSFYFTFLVVFKETGFRKHWNKFFDKKQVFTSPNLESLSGGGPSGGMVPQTLPITISSRHPYYERIY